MLYHKSASAVISGLFILVQNRNHTPPIFWGPFLMSRLSQVSFGKPLLHLLTVLR